MAAKRTPYGTGFWGGEEGAVNSAYANLSAFESPSGEAAFGDAANLTLEDSAWFQGPISRDDAVAMLPGGGDFLVRASASRPGDHVITACLKPGKHVHVLVAAADGGGWRLPGEDSAQTYATIEVLVADYMRIGATIKPGVAVVLSRPVMQCGDPGARGAGMRTVRL